MALICDNKDLSLKWALLRFFKKLNWAFRRTDDEKCKIAVVTAPLIIDYGYKESKSFSARIFYKKIPLRIFPLFESFRN